MKKVFLLLLIVLSVKFLTAQNKPEISKSRQADSSLINSWLKRSSEKTSKTSNKDRIAYKSSAISEQLDSVVYVDWWGGQQTPLYKEEFSYDSYGNLTSEAYYSWDSFNNEWVGDYKESKVFDWNGTLLSNTTYQWNDIAEAWENDYKTEWTYNASGNLIQTTEYFWNNSMWVPSRKKEFTLNTVGLPTESLTYFWDDVANAWDNQPYLKETFTYNANNLELNRTNAFWDGSQWQDMDKTDKTYTSSGLVTSESYYYWNSGSNQWEGSNRTMFSYDAVTSLLVSEILFQWESFSNTWEEWEKTEYTYDISENTIEKTYYYWDNGQWEFYTKIENSFNASNLMTSQIYYWWNNGNWEPDSKTEIVFDAFNNTSEMILYEWIFGINQWEAYEKHEASYDLSVDADDVLYPPFLIEDVAFSNKLMDVRLYFLIGSQWEFAEQYDYYYSPATITSTENKVEATIKVFPNPAADNFMIVHELQGDVALELFDLAGKKVLSADVQNHQPVSIQGVSNGLYVLKITGQNNSTHTQRLVVQQ